MFQLKPIDEKLNYLHDKVNDLQIQINKLKNTSEDIRYYFVTEYTNLINIFFNLTKQQMSQQVPKKDRIGSSKLDLVISLLISLKRKSCETNEIDFSFLNNDRFKLTKKVIDLLYENETECKLEWNRLINDQY